MKTARIMFATLLLAGCATKSRFAYDPRASVLGHEYLDYIAQNPPDRDTQIYYPSFTIHDLGNWTDPSSTLPPTPFPQISALLIDIPPASPEVKAIAGKGYPDLERAGMRLFTAD